MKRIQYFIMIIFVSLMVAQEKDTIKQVPPEPKIPDVQELPPMPEIPDVPEVPPVPDADAARVYKRAEQLLLLQKEEVRRAQQEFENLVESGKLDNIRKESYEAMRKAQQEVENLMKSRELDHVRKEAYTQAEGIFDFYKNRKDNVKLSKEFEKIVFLPGDGRLDVENKYGDVTITGWGKDSVHISAVVTVSRRSEKNAQQALEQIEIQAKLWNKTLRVKSKTNDHLRHLKVSRSTDALGHTVFRDRNGGNYSVDLDISVPEGVAVDLENKYGDVHLKETAGVVSLEMSNGDVYIGFAQDTDIKSKHGNVEVDQIEGSVEVENANGYVSVSQITGNVLVENKYGQVEILDVDGQSEIHNYNNDVSVENVGKSAVIVNKYGSIDISGVKGELDVDSYNGDVDVNSVGGAIIALNKYGKVEVKRANSSVDIENYNGDIELEDVKGSITAETKYGSIEIENTPPKILCDVYNGNIILKDLQSGVADIELKSKYGKVKMNNVESLDAKLELHTKLGSIHFRKVSDIITKDKNGTYSLSTTLGKGKGKISVEGYNTDIHLKE